MPKRGKPARRGQGQEGSSAEGHGVTPPLLTGVWASPLQSFPFMPRRLCGTAMFGALLRFEVGRIISWPGGEVKAIFAPPRAGGVAHAFHDCGARQSRGVDLGVQHTLCWSWVWAEAGRIRATPLLRVREPRQR